MDAILDRLLRYVAIDTRADPLAGARGAVPSSPGQMTLARLLAGELRELGLEAVVSANAYVTGSLPARNASDAAPVIGLLAHLDTACEASGAVTPRVIAEYDGGSIHLGNGLELNPDRFPALAAQQGKTLVVTDGTSLLGADDKAGIAIIMHTLALLRSRPDIDHVSVRVAFVPDEEIGHGAALLDLDRFGADFAYTVDGSGIGIVEYENFNAAEAEVIIKGLAIHPGYAKGHMVNAVLLGQEFLDALPADERPENTSGKEGFYHVTSCAGNVAEAAINLIIRDHDRDRFEQRKTRLRAIIRDLNSRHPADEPRFILRLRDQYRNMFEKIEPHRHMVDTALQAISMSGLTPATRAIRGGTDGAQLSWRGLPTCNLFCGCQNGHGPYEYVAVEDMLAASRTLLHILQAYARTDDRQSLPPEHLNLPL